LGSGTSIPVGGLSLFGSFFFVFRFFTLPFTYLSTEVPFTFPNELYAKEDDNVLYHSKEKKEEGGRGSKEHLNWPFETLEKEKAERSWKLRRSCFRTETFSSFR
jgi:hypothetical protein